MRVARDATRGAVSSTTAFDGLGCRVETATVPRSFVLLPLLCSPLVALAAPTQLIVHADQALRGVPPQLLGANFTSYKKSGTSVADYMPCCLGPAALLPQPIALWRTPGGILGDFFHLNGRYDNDDLGGPPNGIDLSHFIRAAEQQHGQLLHILNINATDRELVNQIEFLNSRPPEAPNVKWTPSSYRFDQAAPEGYFAWLRGQQGHPRPVGVRYVEIGNEIWNKFNDTDLRCNHDAACYGIQAAALAKRLKKKDPALQVGVSVLSIGEAANPEYRNSAVYEGFAKAGTAPDFVFDHAYYNCKYQREDAAEAAASVRFADYLEKGAIKNRAELKAAFPDCGEQIGMFLDEFSPQACADNPDRWESFGPWETAAGAHMFAAGLHAGYTHLSYYDWNDGSDTGNAGLVSGEPGTVDANFWGLWFASKLVQGAISEVRVEGRTDGLRVFATSSDTVLRILLINSIATGMHEVALAVSGRETKAARTYRMDQSYATFAKVPKHRASVPQTAPAAVAVDLGHILLSPLSTTLVELDLGIGAAPTAAAATTGCAKHPSAVRPLTVPDGPQPAQAPASGEPTQL